MPGECSIELEDLAQVWADRCEFETHSLRYPVFGEPGQIIRRIVEDSVNVTEVLQEWADHKNFYTFATDDCQKDKKCGFYKRVSFSVSSLIFFLLFCRWFGPTLLE